MSDDRYGGNSGNEGDYGDDATRPIPASDPHPRPRRPEPEPEPGYRSEPSYRSESGNPEQQPWTSGAQRREHPDTDPPLRYQDPAYPGAVRRSGAGGAFAVAFIAVLIGMAASLGASYLAGHHRLTNLVQQGNLAVAGLVGWPKSSTRGLNAASVLQLSTTNFAIAYAIAAVVTLLLLWAATGSLPAGRGAFSLFLAGWAATLVAGVIALVVMYLVVSDRSQLGQLVSGAANAGAAWALRVGWIVGLIAAIGQSLRRKTS